MNQSPYAYNAQWATPYGEQQYFSPVSMSPFPGGSIIGQQNAGLITTALMMAKMYGYVGSPTSLMVDPFGNNFQVSDYLQQQTELKALWAQQRPRQVDTNNFAQLMAVAQFGSHYTDTQFKATQAKASKLMPTLMQFSMMARMQGIDIDEYLPTNFNQGARTAQLMSIVNTGDFNNDDLDKFNKAFYDLVQPNGKFDGRVLRGDLPAQYMQETLAMARRGMMDDFIVNTPNGARLSDKVGARLADMDPYHGAFAAARSIAPGADAETLARLLQTITGGGLEKMDPAQTENAVRKLKEIARVTGIAVNAAVEFVTQFTAEAQRRGIDSTTAAEAGTNSLLTARVTGMAVRQEFGHGPEMLTQAEYNQAVPHNVMSAMGSQYFKSMQVAINQVLQTPGGLEQLKAAAKGGDKGSQAILDTMEGRTPAASSLNNIPDIIQAASNVSKLSVGNLMSMTDDANALRSISAFNQAAGYGQNALNATTALQGVDILQNVHPDFMSNVVFATGHELTADQAKVLESADLRTVNKWVLQSLAPAGSRGHEDLKKELMSKGFDEKHAEIAIRGLNSEAVRLSDNEQAAMRTATMQDMVAGRGEEVERRARVLSMISDAAGNQALTERLFTMVQDPHFTDMGFSDILKKSVQTTLNLKERTEILDNLVGSKRFKSASKKDREEAATLLLGQYEPDIEAGALKEINAARVKAGQKPLDLNVKADSDTFQSMLGDYKKAHHLTIQDWDTQAGVDASVAEIHKDSAVKIAELEKENPKLAAKLKKEEADKEAQARQDKIDHATSTADIKSEEALNKVNDNIVALRGDLSKGAKITLSLDHGTLQGLIQLAQKGSTGHPGPTSSGGTRTS